MRRLFLCLLVALAPGLALAQSRTVDPADLTLTVTVEAGDAALYRQEMVLITIHGVYRRHITGEKLRQPDLSGFNWMQLGEDQWFDSRINGQKVKNFRRRMALFPEESGTLEIGAFTHDLTLTDEEDDWFPHSITSAPVTVEVAPLPPHEGWWFPVRDLQIEDNWSNPPDQLEAGDGVLRVIRVRAIGAAPEMLPPMPELTSPSAMIFAHPERRFVELSPVGPVAVAFWRWTIKPTNGTSAILEPIEFQYFDTVTRKLHDVTISAQRVAMREGTAPPPAPPPDGTEPRGAAILAAGALAFAAGLLALLSGRHLDLRHARDRFPLLDPAYRALRAAARRGDPAGVRRAAATLARRVGRAPETLPEVAALDRAIFANGSIGDLSRIARDIAARTRRIAGTDTRPRRTDP